MHHDFVPFIASTAEVQSWLIVKSMADIIMGDILYIYNHIDHSLWKYCFRSYDSRV